MDIKIADSGSTVSRDEMIEMYRKMVLIRRVEEMCQYAYDRNKIGGYMHLYIGQEALAVGFASVLKPDDYVLGSYRIHGHVMALGMEPKFMMAELFGKSTGCSKGKGGSMHLFDKEHNFLGGYGIVGGNIPLATGVAFASKYRKTTQATICYFGDGAANSGAFHESVNMASLWKLPIIYVIENNLYALGTSIERASAETELYKRAVAYGMPGKRILAMDVMDVRHEAEQALKYVRMGNGPVIIEAICYRFEGHGAADKVALQTYRTQDEVNEWKKRDPVDLFAKRLKAESILTYDELKAIDDEAIQIAKEAYDFADKSPEPDISELGKGIYTDMLPEGYEKWQ